MKTFFSLLFCLECSLCCQLVSLSREVGVIYLVEIYLLVCMPIRNTKIRLGLFLEYSSISLIGKSDE